MLRRASTFVRDRQIESDADLGPLVEAPPPVDADPEIIHRLRPLYDAGAWVLMESAIADLPADLRWLFESGAVTLDELAALHQSLDLTSAADLAAAAERQDLRRIVGPLGEYAIAAALFDLRAAIARIPLGRATAMAEPMIARLRSIPGVKWAEPLGSLRRGEETVGDIELLAAARDPGQAMDEIARLPEVARSLHRGPQKLYVLIDRAQLGIRFAPPEQAGARLLHLTGPPAHLTALRRVAVARGLRLAEEGLSRSGAPPLGATEEEIYAGLGLQYIPPEIRRGEGEVEEAARWALPALISRPDIRGDLHMHSNWSDGRDSVESMVQACHRLGYQYIAITDHSPHASASRTLSRDDVKRQAAEIDSLRERYAGLTILHGCEVDILPDGRLDFPNRVLEQFDVVLASLHDRAGHSPEQLLRRYTAAMRHPLVSLITHPTNRLFPYRAGYDLDYDRLFELAIETGTALEVDGSPPHLDLPEPLARRAAALGATIVVSSDCHRADMLAMQMKLGLVIGRRARLEPRQVLNARSIDELRRFIAHKRGH